MIDYLSQKFEFASKVKKLGQFKIEINEENAESLTFVNNIGYGKQKSTPFSDIVLQIENIITQLGNIIKMNLDTEDVDSIQSTIETFSKMKEKYDTKARLIENENSRMEVVSGVIRKKTTQHKKSISDTQKRRSAFAENTAELKNQVVELVTASRSIHPYTPFIVLNRRIEVTYETSNR